MTTKTASPDQARFTERRRGSLVFWGFALGLPPLFVYTLGDSLTGPPITRFTLEAAALGLVLYGFFMWLLLGRFGGDFKHLTVDDSGLWIRAFRHLPADQIGEVRHLPGSEAARATASSRIDGTWILRGVATYSWVGSHGEAVFVRQHLPDGGTRPWLLATHRPDELVAALERVRDAARYGPAADPDRGSDPGHHR